MRVPLGEKNMEDDIRKITTEEKETLNPHMLKCINCGVPAVFYVNRRRVCSDQICMDKYRHMRSESRTSAVKQRIYDAKWDLRKARLWQNRRGVSLMPRYLSLLHGRMSYDINAFEDRMDIEAVAKEISEWQQIRRLAIASLEEVENELMEAHKAKLEEYIEYLQEE